MTERLPLCRAEIVIEDKHWCLLVLSTAMVRSGLHLREILTTLHSECARRHLAVVSLKLHPHPLVLAESGGAHDEGFFRPVKELLTWWNECFDALVHLL